MKAVVKYEKGIQKVRLQDMPIPEPKQGEVRIKVAYAGVCGTDLHIYYDDGYNTNPPVIIGHEVCGAVDKCADDVKDFKTGDRVVTETYYYTCGKCDFCKIGKPNLCPQRLSIGSLVDGGFAEYVCVPSKLLHSLKQSVSYKGAALMEPLTCCVQAVYEMAKVLPQDIVLISGPGPMGLLTLQVVKAWGAYVIMTGTKQDEQRMEMAKKLGADELFYVEDPNMKQNILSRTVKNGVDVVFECSGATPAIRTDLDLIKKGGRYVQVGLTGAESNIDMNKMTLKELTVKGTFATKPCWWNKAMELVECGKVNTECVVSDIYPIEQWQEAFEASKGGNGLKYLIDPGNEL